MSEISGDEEDLTAPPHGDAGEPPRASIGSGKKPIQEGALAVKIDEPEHGGGGGPPGGDGTDDASQAVKRVSQSDEYVQAIIEAAPDRASAFRALLMLSFHDRCVGQPIDKAEGAIFESQISAVLAPEPRLRLIEKK